MVVPTEYLAQVADRGATIQGEHQLRQRVVTIAHDDGAVESVLVLAEATPRLLTAVEIVSAARG